MNEKRDKMKAAAHKALALPASERMKVKPFYTAAGVAPDKEFKKVAGEATGFVSSIVSSKNWGLDEAKIRFTRERAGSRAYFTLIGGIHCDHKSTGTAVHELGHFIENLLPVAQERAHEFRKERIKRSGSKDIPMRDISSAYGASEIGNPDDWGKAFPADQAAYVGVTYPTSPDTELISMGFEKLFDDPVGFAQADPEYFKFIVGIARGEL